jgi:hypothetical protein
MTCDKGLVFVNSLNQMTIIPSNGMIPANTIILSEVVLTRWDLKTDDEVFLSIGKHFLSLKVLVERNIHEDEIHVSGYLLRQIHLPIQTYQFHIEFISSNRILLVTPLIGLLTEINEDDPFEPNFRSVHSFCEELDYVTREIGGFFYVFPLQNISQTSIDGYYLQDGKWCKSELPIPDVIYNRIHSRVLEASKGFSHFRKQVKLDQIAMFNDRFLSKWDVYDVLRTEDHLLPYTPFTMLYSQKNLEDMLKKYPIIFLKPIHGSQGKKIIRIEQLDQHINVQFSYFKNQQDTLTLHSIEDLFTSITPYLKQTMYLIQQGIEFIGHKQRLMDFRVLCHKNSQDIWSITSIVARLSAEKQFVSNIARGGETMRPLKALSLYFTPERSKQHYLFMKELAIEFATVISRNSEGITGELGIDIGIDYDGHLWFIEANSKPSKDFDEQEIKVRPSAKAIISYCSKLALDPAFKKELNE